MILANSTVFVCSKYSSKNNFSSLNNLTKEARLLRNDILSLKGHCHAIWQLYKKLEGIFASTEFQY